LTAAVIGYADNAMKGRQAERFCWLRERDKPLKVEIPWALPV
jgi:hypothetical protein